MPFVVKESDKAHKTALLVSRLALEKKGRDIVLLDMRGISTVCDWFVLISAASPRMIKAISKAIDKSISAKKISSMNIQGRQDPQWVLMDYGDVVVHVFYARTREFYALEKLWADAPREIFDDKCLKKTR